MTDDLLSLADDLWTGRASVQEHHPFAGQTALAEIADDTVFVRSFANVTALRHDGSLALVDTSSSFTAGMVRDAIRSWSSAPATTAIYTHGHIDHACGVEPWEAEGPLHVVAHEAVPARFERYRLTAGYNGAINARQFRAPAFAWPTDYRHPDQTYADSLAMRLGDEALSLHHARGETDDATWVWSPQRKILCTGDLIIWASPNAGNPQKVQRYPDEWARALRAMERLDAEILLPGHGLPVIGADRVRAMLGDTAALLEALVAATLEGMNAGATLDQIVHEVRAPKTLTDRPYLRAIYDEPAFVVRNIWRLYGGWYDGNPANLKPAPERDIAVEIAALSGGVTRLVERAAAVLAAGDVVLATHLAEWAVRAAPEDASARAIHARVFDARAGHETSLMAKGIYSSAADESRSRA